MDRNTDRRTSVPRSLSLWMGGALLAIATVISGCQREEIAVYQAPKDPPISPPPPRQAAASMAASPEAVPAQPGLRWKSLPENWTSLGASGLRAANFSVRGSGDDSAEMAVIPLPGSGGTDLDLVNLWRSTLSLPPISEAELSEHTEEASIAGLPVKFFNIIGKGSSDAAVSASQILVATLRRDGFTWFFKLAGDAEVVSANREPLKQFLAEVEFVAPELASSPGGAPPSPSSSREEPAPPKWQVPENWEPLPPTQMVLSKWSVSGEGGEASITVSVFPGDTGGVKANLDRWRREVSLGPSSDAEVSALVNNLDVLGGKATLADFSGTNPQSGEPKRLVAAIVPRAGWSWFYKIVGPPAVVEAHREAFVNFVQTVQYPPRS